MSQRYIAFDVETPNYANDRISAIGTVTLDSAAAIANTRDAYDALTDAQKALVTNYDVLLAAEERLAQLQQQAADQAAAKAVMDQIAAIGTVTLDSADAIARAREAYNGLTDAQKALVVNYDELTAADKQLSQLCAGLGTDYPSRLNLPQQGSFQLGYYHQTQARYQGGQKKEEAEHV